jgi:hypothetical protein
MESRDTRAIVVRRGIRIHRERSVSPQKSLADLSISVNSAKDSEFGWIVVDDRLDMLFEYRDETAWALLPLEMC